MLLPCLSSYSSSVNPDPISSIDHQSYPLLFDSPNLRPVLSALGISSNCLRNFCWTFIFCSLLNVTNGSLTDNDSSAHFGPETIIESELLHFVWILIFDLWLNAGRTRTRRSWQIRIRYSTNRFGRFFWRCWTATGFGRDCIRPRVGHIGGGRVAREGRRWRMM